MQRIYVLRLMLKARNPAAIDDFVIENFVITTGGSRYCFQDKVQGMGRGLYGEDQRSW
jgi:hypothetical protein